MKRPMLRIWILFIVIIICLPVAGQTSESSIRDQRKTGISAGIGWNGLVGLGPILHYNSFERVCFDVGLGKGLVGYKFAGRARFYFMGGNFSPFMGAGAIMSTGTMGQIKEYKDDYSSGNFKLKPAPFLHFVLGLENISKSGFLFSAEAGYAIALVSNVTYTAASPPQETRDIMSATFGSGPVIAFNIGYMMSSD